jgi:ferredoxin-NADP reductase
MPDDAAPPKYSSRLKSRREVAEGTMAFQFEKPPGFVFTAGQFMDVTLISPRETDEEGDTRAFSIASPPHEDSLTITTRMRDTAFKRNLQSMPVGTSVTIAGPSGDLILHEDSSRPAVILTGGIGITPFRSIVLDAVRRKLPHAVSLFYSNRRPEDAAFLDELQALERDHPKFRLIATMTEMEKSRRRWVGERGPIDSALLSRYATRGRPPVYYVAGPPKMVKGLHAMLNQVGVADEDIRTEEFDGY